ncbi:MAG: phage baseplate assembly protein V [Desulfuromonadaceae bacterium]|jgi:phage baseplate assembly protein gpV
MSELYDTLRKMIRQELASQRFAELALVQEVFPADPDNYACDLALRDSSLVLKQVPLLTPRKGLAAVPDVGDLVLVQFVGGDLNRPVIIGTLYNDEDRPPQNAAGQLVINLPSQSDADSALHLELNEADPMSLKLNIGSALELTLQDDDPVVKLDVGGNATLSIDRGGAVTLEGKGELAIKGSGNVKIEAGGELNLKGTVINLN